MQYALLYVIVVFFFNVILAPLNGVNKDTRPGTDLAQSACATYPFPLLPSHPQARLHCKQHALGSWALGLEVEFVGNGS